MSSMKVNDYVTALRRVADVLDTHPELTLDIYPTTAWVFCHDPETFVQYVRAFGAGGKEFRNEDLEFRPEFCGDVFAVNCAREQICERKVVGKRFVPAQVVPERVIPAHEENIVEWDCKLCSPSTPSRSMERCRTNWSRPLSRSRFSAHRKPQEAPADRDPIRQPLAARRSS